MSLSVRSRDTQIKDGKALEQLVGSIEQVVAGNENVAVEPDKWLVDKVTGEEQQFDVVLTIKHTHHTVERGELRIRVNGQGLTLRNPQTGATTPVRYCGLRMVCSVSHTLSPHHRVRYLDKANGKHITDAVVSEFQHGDKTMRMMIVYKQDEGGQVCLTVVPSKKKTKRKIRRRTPMQD